MEQFDVVIIGARCGGSATARLLAASGARVLMVDRASFPSDTLSTHAVTSHGTRLLQRWGLFDRLVALGTPNPRAATVRGGGVLLERMPVEPHAPGYFAPRRTVIDTVLADAAQDAGAVLWDNTSLTDLVDEAGRVAGVVVRRDNQHVTVGADLVVGADGSHSSVARRVGAPTYNERPSAVAGAYAYFADTGMDVPYIGLADHQAVLGFVTNDDLLCLGVAAAESSAGDLLPPTDERFRARIAAIAPEVASALTGARRVSRFHHFRPEPSVMRVPYGPGWALVGDAGHYMDPTTGQGMGNAFLSAQLLSDALIVGDDLSSYHHRRDELLGEMHEITATLSLLEWSNDEVLGRFLEYRALVDQTLAAVDAFSPLATSDLPSTAHAVRA